MGRTVPVILVSVTVVATAAAAAAEWAVKPGPGAACVLESSAESLSDGYQTIQARIRVDSKIVSVISPSVLDPGFNDIGVFVDQHEMIPAERLADSRTAVFECPATGPWSISSSAGCGPGSSSDSGPRGPLPASTRRPSA
jgi:hypothetical protein